MHSARTVVLSTFYREHASNPLVLTQTTTTSIPAAAFREAASYSVYIYIL
jgi:hypothetical protein